jgi:hypothetical protein
MAPGFYGVFCLVCVFTLMRALSLLSISVCVIFVLPLHQLILAEAMVMVWTCVTYTLSAHSGGMSTGDTVAGQLATPKWARCKMLHQRNCNRKATPKQPKEKGTKNRGLFQDLVVGLPVLLIRCQMGSLYWEYIVCRGLVISRLMMSGEGFGRCGR